MAQFVIYCRPTHPRLSPGQRIESARACVCRLMCTHFAAGADPFSIGDFRERRVEAVDVIGGGAGVTAKQLPSILAHPAVLDVVVVFLLHSFISPVFLILSFTLREIIPGLPLDPLLLLMAELQREGGVSVCQLVGVGGADRQGRYAERSERQKGEGWGCAGGVQERRGGGECARCIRVHVWVWSHCRGREGGTEGTTRRGNGGLMGV